MQAHKISFTTLMRLQQHTSLIMLKKLTRHGLKEHIENFVSIHYTIPATTIPSACWGRGLLQCNEGPGFYCLCMFSK